MCMCVCLTVKCAFHCSINPLPSHTLPAYILPHSPVFEKRQASRVALHHSISSPRYSLPVMTSIQVFCLPPDLLRIFPALLLSVPAGPSISLSLPSSLLSSVYDFISRKTGTVY